MMRLSLFVVLLVVPAALADDVEPKQKKTIAREITVKGLPMVRGPFEEVKIAKKEDLEKTFGKDLSETILKEVDLKREFLVLFQWSGSGGDKIEMSEDKGSVTFTYTRGRTRDLRQHAKLFALPNKTEYKLSR